MAPGQALYYSWQPAPEQLTLWLQSLLLPQCQGACHLWFWSLDGTLPWSLPLEWCLQLCTNLHQNAPWHLHTQPNSPFSHSLKTLVCSSSHAHHLLPVACLPLPMVNCLLLYHLLIASSPVTFHLNNQRFLNSASNPLFYDWCCSLNSSWL